MALHVPTNYLLYISHSLSRWGDRMWTFAIGLFLIHLHPQSLIVTAIYEFVVKLFGCCLGGAIGHYIDQLPRLQTMRVSLVVQNSSVAAASILIVLAFQLNVSYYCDEGLFYLFISLVTVLGVVSTLSSAATKIVIERDWIVVLSKDDVDVLSSINAAMRRIDQICLLLAPILSGAFVSVLSTSWAAGLIAVWNIVSFFFEYNLLRVVYNRVPELAHKKVLESQDPATGRLSTAQFLKVSVTSYFGNLKVFMSQKVALIGFCLSLVYLTVLGFGTITIAYLRLNNVQDIYVGIAMGIGAVFGILGTICYTPWTKRFGVSLTGAIGAITLILSITLCLSSVGLEKEDITSMELGNGTCSNGTQNPMLEITGPIGVPIMLILAGITTLRFGLWIYDLAISQHFQEVVPEQERNTVGGVQNSFNSFFDCAYIILTIFISDPNDFDILIIISFCAVAGSCLIYLVWYIKTGGISASDKDRDKDSFTVKESQGKIGDGTLDLVIVNEAAEKEGSETLEEVEIEEAGTASMK